MNKWKDVKNNILKFLQSYKTLIITLLIIFVIYFFLSIYMSKHKTKVVVFDLDETLGHFVEIGVFSDLIEKYNKKN